MGKPSRNKRVVGNSLQRISQPAEEITARHNLEKPMARPELAKIDLVPSTIELLDIDLRLQSKTKAATTIQEVAQTHLDQRSILSEAISEVATRL